MMIHRSTLPALDIPDVPIGELVFANVAEAPDAVAMIDGADGQSWTRRALHDAVARLAGGLAADGIGRGSVVALMAANSPRYAVVFHAIARVGATVTTVNPTYGADEVRYQLNDAGAVRLIVDAAFVETARAAIGNTGVTRIVTIGKVDGLDSIESLYAGPIEQVDVDVHEDVVVLPYSSGTTGLPKGVMLTHANLVANVLQVNATLAGNGDEACLAVLPFFHIYGMQVPMNAALAEGTRVVTMPRFDMEKALALIAEHRLTLVYAVPPMVLGFAKSPLVDGHDLSSLRKVVSGAAPMGAELTDEAATRIGCAVVQAYGMTELSPVSHCTHALQGRGGSSGVIVPGTECRLVGEDGEDVADGETGELWVRGPQVMKGYLNNERATRETLTEDGWLRTGDLARADAEGHFYLVDRLKELIKVKGFQVPPAELEALVVSHPAVADVAVIGVPDEQAGERPKAFVVLKPDASLSADEIKAFVAGHVATYKHLSEVVFVDTIPKSASGKILRRVLRNG